MRCILLPALLFLPILLTPILALSPTTACKSSVYPKLCRALLRPLRFTSTRFDYGRYSVKQSLKQAHRTLLLLDRYLARGGYDGALVDCHQLALLNAEYLETVEALLGRRDSVLTTSRVDHVKAVMSAVVTNQQTCLDGLEGSRVFPELSSRASNETRLYGISLELVTRALNLKSHGIAAPSYLNRGMEGGLVEQDVPITQSVTVAKDGTGNFTTIGDALAFSPNDTTSEEGFFVIFITEGVYEENIRIPKNKKNLKLIGEGVNLTVITGNRSFVDGWTTFNSATLAVQGERFVAMDMTIENTAGPEKHQAVALRNSADLSTFYRCRFLGYQDTLYVHSLRQFYRDCQIYGTVDFIFGNAAVVFQNCDIYARKPLANQFNAITAQGRTHPSQTTGISIHNCTVNAAPDLEADLNSTKTFLGRPWKEYSRTVYMQSFMGSLIEPAGWTDWNGSFALSTLYYGEFNNSGLGANTSNRVQWPGYSLMNATDALNFTVYNFTTGNEWLPSTSIPHSGGLFLH